MLKKNSVLYIFLPIVIMFISIYKQSVFVIKEYKVKIYYGTNYGKIYDKFVGKLREKIFEKLKQNSSYQTDRFDNIRRENMKCSFIILKNTACGS